MTNAERWGSAFTNPKGYRNWIQTLIRFRESVTLFSLFDYQTRPAGPPESPIAWRLLRPNHLGYGSENGGDYAEDYA